MNFLFQLKWFKELNVFAIYYVPFFYLLCASLQDVCDLNTIYMGLFEVNSFEQFLCDTSRFLCHSVCKYCMYMVFSSHSVLAPCVKLPVGSMALVFR